MAKGKEFETIISVAGKVEASLKKSLNDVTSALEQMQDSIKQTASVSDRLSIAIDEQADELKAAKRKYMDYVLAGEEASDEAQELKSRIEKLSSELNSNKARMKAAEDAAERLGNEFDDLGNKARDADNGLSILDVTLGNLAANGISFLAGKAVDGIQSIYGLAEGTREYREDLSKLETAFETAGHATESGTEVYKELFSVFGEEDRAVEAAQQIAKLADSESEMAQMTEIATGAWAMWGDSLATESLMEAMNSTAKIGTVQGTLADALEWCGINLDDFNGKLEGMNSEEERSAYILETLDGLYSDAAANYQENNASIIAARKAQSDYNDTLAAMGEKIEPATTAVQQGLSTILQAVLDVMDGIDFSALATKITEVSGVIANFVTNGIGWLKDNASWLIPVIAGLTAAFAAYKVISMGVAIAEGIKTAALASGVVVTGLASAATWALGAAMAFLTSPIFLVVAAIAAVVAIGVALYRNWDTIKAKASELAAWLSATWANIKAAVSAAWNSILATLSAIWANIKAKASEMANNVKTTITTAWSGLKSILTAPFDALKNAINRAKNAVSGLIEKAKNIKIPSINIPGLATGGFTQGLTFAGEAGTEAVISFDPRYRSDNIGYWAQAGRMLGVDFSTFSLSGSGSSGGNNYFDMGGVTFAPNITVTGNADKETIMDAIEAEYPEFLDLLEQWWAERGAPAYG